ncbi:uncharacterized protein LOC122263444 [Penaeus japonicus]|uniref:uncharacterized protein LOC122263444 n=1 Tax=Penaeus japonicus TaxID=27405 RepID=UPI001C70E84B|nr:uncharacterized protein LOC122263444 [Penaeus japonicus]
MRAAALVLCLAAVVAPLASATLGLLKAGTAAAGLPLALPAAATLGGGLAAVKVLKLIGLKKLKKKFGGFGGGLGGGLGGGYGEVLDFGDSYGKLPLPSFPPTPFHGGAPPFHGGAPPFYIVPKQFFDGRKKRDVQQASGIDITDVKPATLTVQEDDYFSVVFELDRDGCVQKLVCGLSGNVPEQLSADGKVIMSLFKTDSAPAYTTLGSPKGPYDYAAWIGRTSESPEFTCSQLYDQCATSPKELMERFEASEAIETPEAL